MDLGKAFGETERRLYINSLVSENDSRPGIKHAITQMYWGLQHDDQSREMHTGVKELNIHERTYHFSSP